jgi:hypothetical protein
VSWAIFNLADLKSGLLKARRMGRDWNAPARAKELPKEPLKIGNCTDSRVWRSRHFISFFSDRTPKDLKLCLGESCALLVQERPVDAASRDNNAIARGRLRLVLAGWNNTVRHFVAPNLVHAQLQVLRVLGDAVGLLSTF